MDDAGEEWTYTLEFDTPSKKSTEVLVTREVVTRGKRTLLNRPSEKDVADRALLKQTALEQVAANKDFRSLADFFRTIRFMNLVPQLIREGQTSPRVFPGQDPLGRDFLQDISAASDRLRKSRLSRIEKVLRKAVPQFENLRFERDDRGYPHLAVGFKHWRTKAAKQRESQLSDGTLRLIGMLWTLQDKAGPLLLEEPEWSLHSGLLERLAPFISRMLRHGGGRQVFITTHSERMLADQGISPNEILLVVPSEKSGSEIKQAARDGIIQKAMHRGLSAAEAALPHTRIETMNLFGVVA
jgi:predicted ATPase